MSFSSSVAKHFVAKRAAREIMNEIKKAGLDTLQSLANAGISIVGTYLKGCSDSERAMYRRELSAVQSMGVTPQMILSELILQMPALAAIMEGKEGYQVTEVKVLEQFLKEA